MARAGSAAKKFVQQIRRLLHEAENKSKRDTGSVGRIYSIVLHMFNSLPWQDFYSSFIIWYEYDMIHE